MEAGRRETIVSKRSRYWAWRRMRLGLWTIGRTLDREQPAIRREHAGLHTGRADIDR